jgi:insulysin
MQNYPPTLYVAGPRRLALDEFAVDPLLSNVPRASFPTIKQLQRTRDYVALYMAFLNVDNGIVTVLSKSFEGQTDKMERWYNTDYRVREIPIATLNQWRSCESARNLNMDFPSPNQFIPSESGLRVKYVPDGTAKLRKKFEKRMVPQEPPRIIRDDGIEGRWTVYFKEDKQFGKPKGFVIFEVLTSAVFSSPKNAALANLFELCVSDKLREYAYDGKIPTCAERYPLLYSLTNNLVFELPNEAELAGLSYDVKIVARGIRLTFGGYNDKLKRFATFVSNKLAVRIQELLPLDDKEFDRYKDQIMRALTAFDVSQPYSHASYYAQLTVQPRRFQYSNKSLRDATRKTTLPDLVLFARSIWTAGKGICLIQGNFDELEALDLVRSIGDILPFKPISEVECPPRLEALPLPTSDALTVPPRLLIAEPNPSNENSVSYVMLQSLGKTEKDHVLMELLNAVVDEPFYNELRTKQQLGYIVASGIKGLAETRTLSFIVQSSIAASTELTLAILKFLDDVENKLLAKLPSSDLAVYIKSIIEKKTDPDKDLSIEATRNWSEISSGRFQFDRLQREAAALLDIDKQDLLNFWRRIYVANGRRVLITEIIPRLGAASSQVPQTSTGYGRSDFPASSFILGVDDIDQFRRDRESQPVDSGIISFPTYNS